MFDELLSSPVDQLKPRIALLGTTERPSRKVDIIALLRSHMLSSRLRGYWEKLEPLDRHAVAETIHNWDRRFDLVRFVNKYSDIPLAFSADGAGVSRHSRRDAHPLRLFLYNGIVPDELCARLKEFVRESEPDVPETLPDAYSPEGQKYPENPASSPFRVRRVAMEAVVRHDLPALLHLVDSGQIGVSDKTGLATTTSTRKIDTVLMGGDFYVAEDENDLKKWDPGTLRPIRPYALALAASNRRPGETQRE